MSALDPEKGRANLAVIIGQLRTADDVRPEDFVQALTWHGFLWIIRERLDTIYPAPNFRTEAWLTWRADADYGPGVDPGVKWATLLDLALEQLADASKSPGDDVEPECAAVDCRKVEGHGGPHFPVPGDATPDSLRGKR